MPLSHGRSKRKDYEYVLEKVKRRLSGWKASCLSMAGGVTLAKYELCAQPIYPVIIVKLPLSIRDDLEKLEKAFLWGQKVKERKLHLVNWKQVQKPREFRGLEALIRAMNEAYLIRLAWNLRSGGRVCELR